MAEDAFQAFVQEKRAQLPPGAEDPDWEEVWDDLTLSQKAPYVEKATAAAAHDMEALASASASSSASASHVESSSASLSCEVPSREVSAANSTAHAHVPADVTQGGLTFKMKFPIKQLGDPGAAGRAVLGVDENGTIVVLKQFSGFRGACKKPDPKVASEEAQKEAKYLRMVNQPPHENVVGFLAYHELQNPGFFDKRLMDSASMKALSKPQLMDECVRRGLTDGDWNGTKDQMLVVLNAPVIPTLALEFFKDSQDVYSALKERQEKSQPPLPLKSVQPLFTPALAALLHIHRLGVAHLDVKLENMLINGELEGATPPKLKLIDFGHATISLREISVDKGTPANRPPEMHDFIENMEMKKSSGKTKKQKLTHPPPAEEGYDVFAVDAWTLGAALFHLLAGSLPYEASPKQDEAWANAVVAAGRPNGSLSESLLSATGSPALPEPLMKLLDGLLEPIPAKRITLAKAETLAGDKAAWSLPVYRGLSTASQMPMPKLRARWKAAVPQYDDENEDL